MHTCIHIAHTFILSHQHFRYHSQAEIIHSSISVGHALDLSHSSTVPSHRFLSPESFIMDVGLIPTIYPHPPSSSSVLLTHFFIHPSKHYYLLLLLSLYLHHSSSDIHSSSLSVTTVLSNRVHVQVFFITLAPPFRTYPHPPSSSRLLYSCDCYSPTVCTHALTHQYTHIHMHNSTNEKRDRHKVWMVCTHYLLGPTPTTLHIGQYAECV